MKTFIYTPTIPNTFTKGYGRTCKVMVIRAGDNFKTLNSKHEVLKDFGTVRMDYGLIKGRSRKILDAAKEYLYMVTPGERTTVEEF